MPESAYFSQIERGIVAKLWQNAEAAGMSPQDFIKGIRDVMSAGISARAQATEAAQDNERVLVTAPSGFVVDLTPPPQERLEAAEAFFGPGGPGHIESNYKDHILRGMEEEHDDKKCGY